MNRPLLLGHRGARKYAPENTIAAFELALDHGCDGFEFDVRLTADGVAVVCHDAKFCGVSVGDNTYESLVERASGRGLARLEQVLELGSRAFLNVELKVEGLEEIVIERLKKYPAEKGVVVSSFLPVVVSRLHELGAEFPLGIICENRRQLGKVKELPVQAVMVGRGLVTPPLVRKMQNTPLKPKEGLNGAPETQIFVWTVNSARDMRKFAEMRMDGIISDDTKLLVETVGRRP